MSKKLKVAVLMGGPSPEHDISILSGRNVVENLNKDQFEVYPIVIGKENDSTWLKCAKEADNVLIALHGPVGQDGTVQKQLDGSNIPYTGSGAKASSIGMDKLIFRELMKSKRIRIPNYVAVKKGEAFENIEGALGEPPFFVKPSNQGSSVGNTLVKNIESLQSALDIAYEYSGIVLVDEYVKGIEVTCGILGNDSLPIAEIIPKNEFFDYESKYTENGAEEIVPARLSEDLTKEVKDLTLTVHNIVGCRGFSRVDFIINDKDEPVVLEINTIPGLTPFSILPKEAEADGISYGKLLTRIITLALDYYGKQ